jgi:hypothetical protein
MEVDISIGVRCLEIILQFALADLLPDENG